MSQPLILDSKEASRYDASMLGGKAANMAWMTRNGFPVPDWVVVTTHAYDEHLRQDGLKEWVELQMELVRSSEKEALPKILAEIRKRVAATALPPSVEEGLARALAVVNDWENEYFAVRSSVVGEDAAGASFAGQMESFLFQKGKEGITRSIRKCFASAFTDRAILYRIQKKLPLLKIEAAVIVQVMVEGRVSGVMFTAHPANGSRKHALVSSGYGIGEGIVSGLCNTDEYTVGLEDQTVSKIINQKDTQMIFNKETGSGVLEVPVAANLHAKPSLTDAEVLRLVDCGRMIAQKLRHPQDIEWAFRGDELYILQTRPITQLPPPSNPKGELIVWDNSNIQESFNGVTTPLTFSFANLFYREMYTQTMRIMELTEKEIQEHAPVVNNLLGLIRGRVYYNINNWYRGLLFLPGFKTNKADMERMMGLADPVDMIQNTELPWDQKLKKIPGLILLVIRTLLKFRRINQITEDFRALFKSVYDRIDRSTLHELEIAELMDMTAMLKRDLIMKWDAPIINDVNVMMANGRVHRWLEKIGIENTAVVQNNLLSGEEGIESTEPTKMLLRMCATLRKTPELRKIFEEVSNQQLLAAIQHQSPSFYEDCLVYIELFGDRTIGELKLESKTLRQDPSFMFSILKNFLTREELTIETLNQNEEKFRTEAEELCFKAVMQKYGRRKLAQFKKDVDKLRNAIKNRENMRLARTRLFGLYRDIFLEIGKQLHFYGQLEDPRDILFLKVDELETYMEGRCVQSDLKILVAGRKQEYQRYKEEAEPSHHFYTTGAVYHHNNFEYPHQAKMKTPEGLKGTGCYPGVVEEKIRLIFSPEDELSLNGQILCTVRTDPGWAPLFPTAGGIIVERGSTLSHSAVVARELGIPAIVGIPGITKILKDGELIRMNGESGIVELLSKNE
ncbi:phosphoenolpyruvate synthase [Deltaproteobacteria bacterium TL4]